MMAFEMTDFTKRYNGHLEEAVQGGLLDIKQHLLTDAEQIAINHIKTFFTNKKMYFGGAILEEELLTDRYIQMVIHTNVVKGVEHAYKVLEHCMTEDDENHISDDIRLVVKVLEECGSLGIPKCFAAGILLVYLELCEGYVIEGI